MASDKNELIISGNLVRDPEIRTTHSGTPVCNFSIASNKYHKKDNAFEKEVSFFDVQCWGNLALDIGENCHKGTPIELKGRLKQESWTDREGKKKSKVVIVAGEVNKISRQERQTQTEEYPF